MATRDSLRRRRRTSSIFEETEVLADMLEDLTYMYAGERQPVSVNTGTRSAMEMDSSYHVTTDIRDEIGRVLTGPNKLRYIVDDLAHAIEHDNVSDFDLIREMVAQYDESEAKIVIAATVVTMVEDQFVDTNRVNRHRGHRRRVAFKHAIQMRGALRPPLEDLSYEAVPMEAFIQLATAGYIKDPDSIERQRKLIFRWMREKIQTARTEQDPIERLRISKEITEQLLRMTETNHTEAQNHVFDYPPPTHDLDAILNEFNVDQTSDGSDLMNKLKSRFNRAKKKAKQKRGDGDQTPDELPDDFDPEDFETDGSSSEDGPTHQSGDDEVNREEDGGQSGQGDGQSSSSTELQEPEEDGSGGRPRKNKEQDGNEQKSAAAGDETEKQSSGEQDEDRAAGQAGEEGQKQDGDETGEQTETLRQDENGDEEFSRMSGDSGNQRDEEETVSRSDETEIDGQQGEKRRRIEEESGEAASRGDTMQEEGEETASIKDALDAGDVGEWYSAGEEEDDYISPSDNAKERFKSLKRAVVKRQMGDLNERRSERDDRIEEDVGVDFDVETEVEKRGLAEEVAREFRKIKTRDRNVRDTKGRRLEMRQAQRNIAGNPSIQDVWLRRKRAEVGDRAIGVAVDLSGSMDAHETMIALGTLSKAVDIIGDDLIITTFHRRGASLVTGPNEEFRWDHLNAARAGGKTPTAHGILDGQLLLDECNKREKVLFVLTDGRPNVSLEETGTSAIEDAKSQVQDARRDDVKVIGLGLSSVDETQMEQMFGENNYIMVNEQTLAQDLIEVYRSQLNVDV